MRDLLLSVIVLACCARALVKPQVGVLAWVWFALMRPDILAWVENARPYSWWLALATLAGSFRFLPEVGILFGNPIVRCLLVLQIPRILSAFTAVVPELAAEPFNAYVKMLIIVLVIPLHIRTLEDFRKLFLTVAVSLGAVGFKFGLYGLLHGGVRYAEGYGGSLAGNNEVGMAFAMIVPFCWYAREMVKSKWARNGFLVLTLTTVAGLVMTYSRGAALGLLAVFLLIMAHSQRKIGVLLAAVILTFPAVYLAGDSYTERLKTIEAPTQEASANSRVEYWGVALRMAAAYPVLGVGFGAENQQRLMASYIGEDDSHVIHNTYLQVLVDSGIPALAVFAGLLFGTIIWLGRATKRARKENPELMIYPAGVQASLVAFAVSGAFGSRDRYDFLYILLMTAAAWYNVEESAPDWEEAEEEAVEAHEQTDMGHEIATA